MHKVAFSSVEGSMKMVIRGNMDGAVVRTLVSRQCGPGSIPGPGVICGLSLLLVLYSAPRDFSRGYSGFPLSSKTNIFKFQIDPGMHGHFIPVLENSWCSVGKQITNKLQTNYNSFSKLYNYDQQVRLQPKKKEHKERTLGKNIRKKDLTSLLNNNNSCCNLCNS